MHRFEDLEVWRLSYGLALQLYRDTRSFPADERFGMVQQIRRCATSVPANIAEGSRRSTDEQFRYFLGVGDGSNAELDVFLRFSEDLGYMSPEIAAERRALNARISRMLTGLIISLGPHPRK